MLRRDVPSSAEAYEYFLRGNQLSYDSKQWSVARDLYLQMRRRGPALCAGVGAPRPDPSRDGQVPTERERRRVSFTRRRRSGGRSSSIPICRSPTSCSRSSRWISVARTTRWPVSSSARTPPTRSCWPAWSAPAGTAACSTHRSLRTLRALELEPKIRTSVGHTWFLQADHARVATVKIADYPYIVAISLAELGRTAEALLCASRARTEAARHGCAISSSRPARCSRATPAESIAAVGRIVGVGLPRSRGAVLPVAPPGSSERGWSGARSARTRRRRRILLFSGDGPRSVARLAAQETGLHAAATAGTGPTSGGVGSVHTPWGRQGVGRGVVRLNAKGGLFRDRIGSGFTNR